MTALARRLADNQKAFTENPHPKDDLPENRKLLSALWGLVSDGIVYPRLGTFRESYPSVIEYVVLTEKGEQVVDRAEEHPLHPGFMSRFRSRCSSVEDGVIARLEDAIACAERGLLRAAVVMIGLAVEETVDHAYDAAVKLSLIKSTKNIPAAQKVAALSKGFALLRNAEERRQLQIALVAAENVRTERNRAAHPGEKFEDAGSVEELLVSSCRQIPVFWNVLVSKTDTSNP